MAHTLPLPSEAGDAGTTATQPQLARTVSLTSGRRRCGCALQWGAASGDIMKTEEMQGLHSGVTSEAGRRDVTAPAEAYHRFRLLATMVQGTAAALPEAWKSYGNVAEARIAAREMMRNHRVLRVAIVADRIPTQFVEWVGR